MSNIQVPIVVFGNNRFLIKGGFWDGRLEINILNTETKEDKDYNNFSIHVQEGPVVLMEISKNEKLLICGTLYGYLVAYKIEYINNGASIKLNLIKKIYDHDGLINSISINDNLNMFATCGNDDKINLYLLPTFEAFRCIKFSDNSNNNKEEESIEANNVFLSYSPLPSVSVFINSKKIFKSYTINGQYIGEMPEDDDSNLITCSVMFNDLSFCDYVIYGTNDGMIKIRSFPEMNLVNSKVICDDNEIVCLEISLDKRYCYVWNEGGEITVIKDITVNDPAEVEHKKSKFK
jgi:WD40 repeat protein